jgi:PleD family two-component response regulator
MSKYVLAAVDDMFFASKIKGTAEHVGLQIVLVKSVERAIEKALEETPSIIIADLHSTKFDPFILAAKLKATERLRDVPLIGFFSHVQTELQRRAEQSGFDKVMPRSAFSKQLPEILKASSQ